MFEEFGINEEDVEAVAVELCSDGSAAMHIFLSDGRVCTVRVVDSGPVESDPVAVEAELQSIIANAQGQG